MMVGVKKWYTKKYGVEAVIRVSDKDNYDPEPQKIKREVVQCINALNGVELLLCKRELMGKICREEAKSTMAKYLRPHVTAA
ncbi:hypothetical protein ACE6H2_025072 [Prunus campanulata]